MIGSLPIKWADGAESASGVSAVEPLLVTPKRAGELLGLGKTTVFDLLNKGILERRKIGKATRITLRSVHKLAGI